MGLHAWFHGVNKGEGSEQSIDWDKKEEFDLSSGFAFHEFLMRELGQDTSTREHWNRNCKVTKESLEELYKRTKQIEENPVLGWELLPDSEQREGTAFYLDEDNIYLCTVEKLNWTLPRVIEQFDWKTKDLIYVPSR